MATLLALLCGEQTVTAAWWSLDWQYRRGVTIPAAKPTGLPGEDVAVVTMPTAGLIAPGGRDLRVVSSRGSQMPLKVLMNGPGDFIRLAFAVQRGVRKYYVYFGNPKAAPARELDIRRGVLLSTWEYPGGGIRTLQQVRAIAGRTKKFLGRDFRPDVFLGHNPFGPQDRLVNIFTGWLICRQAGTYTFAISSKDASFLLVNDKLIVSNGGWHPPQRDTRRRGQVRLKAGLHKLTFYHVSLGGDPVAVAAWKEPSSRRIWKIPSSAFAPVSVGKPGPLEQYAKAITVDFIPEHLGEAFMMNRYYQRYAFKALTVAKITGNISWKWDFGDGQSSTNRNAIHVYLLPGEYTVTLTAKTFAGRLTRTNRIFVSRQWDRTTENRLDGLKEIAGVVRDYDFRTLSPAATAQAVLLLDRTRSYGDLIRAGDGLISHAKAPPRSLREAMGPYADALVAGGKAEDAVAALVKAASMVRAPAVSAELLVKAGDMSLIELGDADGAMGLFQSVIKKYGLLTTAGAIRQARIGIGDVWRLRGDAEKARGFYAAAKTGNLKGKSAAIVRGDFARHVEEYLRKRQVSWAGQKLAEWEKTLPLDKLEGYTSLLRARLYLERRRYSAAVNEAETLVRVNPASNYAAQLLMLAADAYGRLGKKPAAATALKRVVKDYPESPLAADAAGRLKKLSD